MPVCTRHENKWALNWLCKHRKGVDFSHVFWNLCVQNLPKQCLLMSSALEKGIMHLIIWELIFWSYIAFTQMQINKSNECNQSKEVFTYV